MVFKYVGIILHLKLFFKSELDLLIDVKLLKLHNIKPNEKILKIH